MQRTLRPDIVDLGGDLDFTWGTVHLRRTTPEMGGAALGSRGLRLGLHAAGARRGLPASGLARPHLRGLFEDADLCVRARKAGYRTVVALHAQSTHKVVRRRREALLWQDRLPPALTTPSSSCVTLPDGSGSPSSRRCSSTTSPSSCCNPHAPTWRGACGGANTPPVPSRSGATSARSSRHSRTNRTVAPRCGYFASG
jgi:hypothetical protein